ncbi:MAG TPA: hypothetical protein VFW66_06265 [Gemmatimonadales bacterium]|nr:hypothetical protein [Gemmatimonadales bacterium]
MTQRGSVVPPPGGAPRPRGHMQQQVCPHCGLTVRRGRLACEFCGGSLVAARTYGLAIVIAATLLVVVLLVGVYALHSGRPTVAPATTGAIHP